MKHDLSSQIPDFGYNFCEVNNLFETLRTSNVNIENLSIGSKGLVIKKRNTLEKGTSLKVSGVFEYFQHSVNQ